jgi:ATP-dependent Clp protease ATP-binding subunit ClpB
VKLEVKRLGKRLAERQITMDMTDAALNYLADIGYDPVYGARPLKRAIQRELETIVARGILKGDFTDGDTISVTADDSGLIVDKVVDAEIFTKAMSGTFE